jgi:hypothetical protein
MRHPSWKAGGCAIRMPGVSDSSARLAISTLLLRSDGGKVEKRGPFDGR